MKYFIHCYTNWCSEEETYRAIADNESQLLDLAEQLAYDNFIEGDHKEDIMNSLIGECDFDEDYEEAYNSIDETDYYGYGIEEANEGEWNEYDTIIYKCTE